MLLAGTIAGLSGWIGSTAVPNYKVSTNQFDVKRARSLSMAWDTQSPVTNPVLRTEFFFCPHLAGASAADLPAAKWYKFVGNASATAQWRMLFNDTLTAGVVRIFLSDTFGPWLRVKITNFGAPTAFKFFNISTPPRLFLSKFPLMEYPT